MIHLNYAAIAGLGITALLGFSIISAQSFPTTAIAANYLISNQQAAELLKQGQAQVEQGNYQKAIIYYTQALQIDPQYTKAYLHRGITYHRLGDFDQAIANFQSAIQTDSSNADAFYYLGEAQARLSRHNKALESMSQAIHLDPNTLMPTTVEVLFTVLWGIWSSRWQT